MIKINTKYQADYLASEAKDLANIVTTKEASDKLTVAGTHLGIVARLIEEAEYVENEYENNEAILTRLMSMDATEEDIETVRAALKEYNSDD